MCPPAECSRCRRHHRNCAHDPRYSARSQISWMLLCCQGRFCELVVEVAGEVSLEGSHGLSFGLSFGDLALYVGAALGVVDGAGERDRVDRCVDLAVASAAEAVPDGLAR